MRRTFSKLTFRLSISIAFLIVAATVLLSLVLPRAASSTQPAKKSAIRSVGESNPYVNLQEGRELDTSYDSSTTTTVLSALRAGGMRPLAMTSGDLNQDGYPDLACGYASTAGGILSLYRGDPEAFAPQDPEVIRGIAQGRFPDPFHKDASAYELPEAPDFLGAGDFNRDGMMDIVTAARGGHTLYLLEGQKDGGYSQPRWIPLPGSVTTMITGGFNNRDGLIEVLLGIDSPSGSSLLVYGGMRSILETEPQAFTLPATASFMALGHLDDDPFEDLAILANGQVAVLHGRDNSGASDVASKKAGKLEMVESPFTVRAIALGEFIWDRDSRVEMALLADDGAVHIVARGELDTRPWTTEEIFQRRLEMQRLRDRAEKTRKVGGPAMMASPSTSTESLNWEVVEDLPAAPADSVSAAAALSGADSSQPLLLSTRISSLPSDDLLVLNPARRQLQVIYKSEPKQGDAQLAAKSVGRASASLEADDEVTAVLPMRVGVDARPGLVVMSKGNSAPSVIVPLAGATFTVTRADDPAPNGCAVGDCSLREAIIAANGDVGSDTIVFNPGINPTLSITSGGGHEDAAATGDLDITSNVVITGNNQTVISTNYTNTCGDCKVFGVNQLGVTNGLAVSFTGVTIQNGFNDGSNFSGTFFETGGGIDFFMTGSGNNHSMTNCVITNNKTQDGARSHGGGINVDGANTATPAGPSGGTISFTSCTISNNTATNDGGGGMFLAADKHDATLTNCVVTGNSQLGASGGGMQINHSFGGTVTVTGASGSVSNNTASTFGGGIAVSFNQVTNISNITISNNTSTGTGGSSLGGGVLIDTLGAAGVTGSTNLTGVTISTNHANNGANAAGGGVRYGGFYAGTMTNCTVSGNTSKNGAGVVNSGSTQTPAPALAISGGSFTTNAATGDGGAFASTGTGSPTASVTTFSNVAIGAAGQANTAVNGGGIADTQTGSVTVTNNSITGNSATTNGGGIFISGGTLTLNGVTVDSNTATTGDGLFQSAGTFTGQNTINFNGGDSINLTGGTFNSTSGTLNLTGNFTNSGGSFVHNSGTVVFNGTTAQSLGGSTSSTFNILTVNKTGTLTLGVNTTVANVAGGGNLSLNAGTFDLSTFTINRAAAGGTLTVSNGTTLKIGGTNTLPANYSTHSIGATSTIEYSGTNQNVAPLNSSQKYGNLVTSGSGTKTLTGAISIATSLTIGAGTTLDVSASNFAINDAGNWTNNGIFTPRSGLVTFDGSAGTQTLAGNTTFFNLTLNNPGATTAFGNTSTTIGNNLVTTAGTMNGGTSTITFTGGAGAISGASDKNFNNLVINGVITNTAGGNTNIANDYTGSGTFTQAAGLTTTFTTGDGTHNITGTGATTFGVVVIQGSTVVDGGAHNFSVVGASFDVAGTFNGNTGTVTFSGAIAQTIQGAGGKNFAGLTINNANGVTVANVASAVDASVSGLLTLTTDLTIAAGAVLQQSGTSAGGADAIGTVRRTDLGVTARAFGNPNVTIAIDSGTAPTQMDVNLVKAVPPDFTTSVARDYTLTPTSGSGISATVKLHYLDAELNGNAETKLALWKKIATVWTALGRTGAVDTVNNAVTLAGVASFSEWTLAAVDPPTISKAFSASTIPLNGTTTVTFTITNPNTLTGLSGVAFTDNLPAGLVVADVPNVVGACGGTVTAVAGSSTISLSGGTIAASGNCVISVDVKGTTGGAKNNTTGAPTATESGPGVASNTATVTVLAPPTISKAFGAGSIPLNGTTTLTFTLTNPNSANGLTGVAFTDNLPTGLVVADTPGVVNNCGTGTVTAVAGASSISYSGGSLTASQSCTIVVNVKGTTAGAKSNTTDAITSTDGGTGATSNTAQLAVVAPPTISKAFGASSIALNGTTTLTFTITNPAVNTVAQAGVAFTDNLPAGLVVADTPGVVNNCGSGTVTAVAGASSISYTGGTVGINTSCTIVVNVKGTTEGQKNNTTDAISSTTGGTGATSNTASVTVSSPPTYTKAFGAATIPLNGSTTLMFTITNPNAGLTLTGISFSDNLPAGLEVANPAGISSTCTGTWNATPGDTTLNFGGGTLAPMSSCTLSVNITGTTSGLKSNTGNAITSTEGGTGATSNTAMITVIGAPTISKAFGAAAIPLNGTTTLTFTINNPNSTALTGVSFTDSLPAGLEVAGTPNVVNNCGGTFAPSAGDTTLTYTGGTVAGSGSCTVSVDVKGTTGGAKSNTTSAITSTEGGTGATSNTAILTVIAPPTIAKVFGASNIPLNGTTTLTFTITNPNTSDALTGVAFTDNLPSGLVVADTPGIVNNCGSGTVTAVALASTITYSGGTIAANSSCTIVVNVKGTTQGVKLNTTDAITSTNGGTGATSNTAQIAVASPPMISKAFSAANIPVGGTTTITFTLMNTNSSLALTGVAFSDSLPAGLVVAASPNVVNSCGSGTVTAVAGASTISYSGGTLATMQICTITVDVTGTVAGVKNNTTGPISSTETGAGGTSNTATIEVVAPPTISKAFGVGTIPLNGTTTLTFTITNPNTLTTLTGISFTDNLPAGLVVADVPGVVNNCGSGTVTAVAGASSISYSGGTLAPGPSCTIIVNVKGTSGGAKNNTTDAISATESGAGATSNTASVTVIAPPTIAKVFGASNIPLNGTTTLTFTITNPNTSDALTGVAFTDNLPSGLVVADTPGVVNNCGSGTVTAVALASTITYSGGTIAANSSCTIVVNVKGTTQGVKLNTTDAITSTNGGTGATSNTAQIAVASPPTISKAFSAANIPVGGTTTITFTLTNTNMTLGLTGVSFSDTLPAGLVVAASPNVVNNCGSGTVTANPAASTISYSGGTFAANQSCTILVDVTGTVAGVKNNTTGPISSTETGAGGTSNTATIEVVAPPTISKAFGVGTIPLNGTTTLTFTITNPNTLTTLTGISFTDTLPAGLVVADVPGVVNNCGSGTVTAVAGASSISYSGGTLAPGPSCTIIVNVKGTSGGAKSNTTGAISAAESGAGATSNTASVTVIAPPTIAKVFGASTIPLNGTTTLTFTITNPNTVDALTGVAFTDNLPAGLVVADVPGVVNNCGSGTVTAVAAASSISYSGGTIAANSSCTIVVNVKGTTPGVKNNTTDAITSANGGTGAVSNTAMVAVAAPPTISKAFGASSIPLNGTTTLTFTLSNPNSAVGVTGVAFTDNLPAGLVVADVPGVVNNCGSGTVTAVAGASTISYSGGSLATSQTCTIVVNVKGVTAGSWDNTTGVISSTETGDGATSNTATIAVVAPPTISKAFGASSIPLNGTTTLTFTITNPAANTVGQTGVAFSDTLPAGLVVADVPGVVNNCGSGTVTAVAGSNTISYSGGSVATNSSCTIVVNVMGTAAGTKNNTTGAISSTNGGTGATSNTAVLTVVAPPTISKAFGAAAIPLNGTTTLTFTLTNPAANTVALTGVAFTDNLPAGLVVDSTPGVVNNCGSGTVTAVALSSTITYTGGTLAVGQTCTIVVNVKGTTSGTKSNTTGAITSTNGGTGATSNTAILSVNSAPVAMCKDVTVSAGANCTADASIDNGSFDPDPGDTITLTQSPPGPYPLGTTNVTLTVTDNHGASSQCMGTVTVVDTTPPVITCPANVSGVTNQAVCQQGGCSVVNFPAPTVTDNCPGAQVVCVPPSGSCIPTGTTTVTCTATDAGNNMASCTFTVSVFDVCLQDDSNPNTVLLLNSQTGQFKFCCLGVTYTGTATLTIRGCTISFQQLNGTQRLFGTIDKAVFKGSATIQSPPGVTKCTITDRDIRNNSCICP